MIDSGSMNPPFWQQKTLEEMSPEEWESLCDGCAKCCLNKLEDPKTKELWYTNVACNLLDLDSGRCGDYLHRSVQVPQCVTLTPENSRQLYWMPRSCAYRLLAEGKPLPTWHPLQSGRPDSVARAGHSVCGRVILERDADDLQNHLITWIE